MVWRIRPATPGDAGAMERLRVATWKQAYRGIVPDGYLDKLTVRERAVAWWAERLAAPPSARHRCHVADIAGVPAGFATAEPTRDADLDSGHVGEVGAIYLRPEHWSRGIGRALMATAVDGLRSAGFRAAMLWTLEGNERTRNFYAAAGWNPDGARKLLNFGADVAVIRYRIGLESDR